MYALAQFRLTALDRRVPLAAGALGAFLATVTALPTSVQLVVLLAVPISLIWVFRTTINSARSFEDVIRRIEQIELAINRLACEDLLRFQSSHPSRGRTTGGRTGAETVRAVLVASLLTLLTCGWLAEPLTANMGTLAHSAVALYLATIAFILAHDFRSYRRYRYAPMRVHRAVTSQTIRDAQQRN